VLGVRYTEDLEAQLRLLEDVLARLHAAGYRDAHIIDEAFGRSLRVTDPDGVAVQVNESDPQLYP